MPKLTKEQLNEVRYVSLNDLSSRLDQIDSIEDKVAFATRYLLSHGMGETDCTFAEAVHVARMKVAEASLKSKEKLYNDDNLDLDPADYPIDEDPAIVDAFVEDKKDDLENEMFIGNPVEYLKGKAKDLADEIEDKDVEFEKDTKLKENCLRLRGKLNNTNMKDILKVDTSSNELDIELRLKAKFGNRNIAKEMKPGFLSKAFGTSSTAYANLDAAYNAFKNPNHVLHGDINSLAKAANEYLQHRFKGWRPDQPLPMEQIYKLSGTEKSRSEFSAAIIEAKNEHEKVYGHFSQLVSTNKDKQFNYDDLKNEGKENEFQLNFQNQLKNDISMDDSSLEDDSVEYIKINSKEKENVDDSLDMDDDDMSMEN